MVKWIRIFGPLAALMIVMAAGFAALGAGRASARPALAPLAAEAAQPSTSPTPTETPKSGPAADEVDQHDRSQRESQDGATKDGTADAETKDSAATPDNEAADAASLSGKATVTADEAKATALAANPGTTVVTAELGDENGLIVYSVELSNGADVKVDAQRGTIVSADQAGSDTTDATGDQEAPDTPKQ
jgi:uncharacterized membrane protein YkoI